MPLPSVEFLSICLAEALLDHLCASRPPVPIRELFRTPPPDLKAYIGLKETAPFGEAYYVKDISGRGAVLVNNLLDEPERRYSIARALFFALCHSEGGQRAGLPNAEIATERILEQAAFFARNFLMPVRLFPKGWEAATVESLAALFEVPVEMMRARMAELKRIRPANGGWAY
jgi:Zn-dependent peptidase ImmA (M78 family)